MRIASLPEISSALPSTFLLTWDTHTTPEETGSHLNMTYEQQPLDVQLESGDKRQLNYMLTFIHRQDTATITNDHKSGYYHT